MLDQRLHTAQVSENSRISVIGDPRFILKEIIVPERTSIKIARGVSYREDLSRTVR